MNRKGFTLIEVLAVIIILGIILVIAAPNILNVYKNSKLKSEQIFVDRLSDVISSYIKLNIDSIEFDGGIGYVTKGDDENINIEQGIISIEKIVETNMISSKDFINPSNKVTCNSNDEIEVYRDPDFVYCYKVKKNSLNCLTDEYKASINGEYVIDTCVWDDIH